MSENQPQTKIDLTREQRIFNYIQTALQSLLFVIIIVLNFVNGHCNNLPPISIGNETIANNASQPNAAPWSTPY